MPILHNMKNIRMKKLHNGAKNDEDDLAQMCVLT